MVDHVLAKTATDFYGTQQFEEGCMAESLEEDVATQCESKAETPMAYAKKSKKRSSKRPRTAVRRNQYTKLDKSTHYGEEAWCKRRHELKKAKPFYEMEMP